MSRFHTLTIADVRRETADSVSLAFAVPDALKADFAFTPGQYLTVRATLDGEECRRSRKCPADASRRSPQWS
jgi:ring-1,2-phenylacetyl-CoA epoxidase subunit PaaE